MLLCKTHHRLLHEGGFNIKQNYRGEHYFETSQGKVIPEAPVYQRRDEPDIEGIAEQETVYDTSAEVLKKYY